MFEYVEFGGVYRKHRQHVHSVVRRANIIEGCGNVDDGVSKPLSNRRRGVGVMENVENVENIEY